MIFFKKGFIVEEVPVGKFGYVRKQTVDWFTGHASWLVTGGIAVVVTLVVSGRLLGWFRSDAQVDYVAAHLAYDKWDVVKLEKIIKRHPELHAKYDAPMAQKLLSSSTSGLASGYAAATLKRVGDSSPYYTQFAKATLMIVEGKLAEALLGAKQLKETMEGDQAFWENSGKTVRHGSLLFAYNLLRIAMLEKAAGSPQGELLAWGEFEKFGNEPSSQTYDPEAYLLLQQNFQKQNVSLLDYIHYRKASLISKSP